MLASFPVEHPGGSDQVFGDGHGALLVVSHRLSAWIGSGRGGRDGGVASAMPILAGIALGGHRKCVVPLLRRVSWTALRGLACEPQFWSVRVSMA